jgi:hypothetical protein
MTAQVGETLILDGRTTSMSFCPPLPAGHPGIVQNTDRDAMDGLAGSTACWRGYIGTWEVRDGLFYLKELEGRLRLAGDVPLLADWFSGVLRIPSGEILLHVHMGFASVFEFETHIKVTQGRVVSTRVIDNRDKSFDRDELAMGNLPGCENFFDGDDW